MENFSFISKRILKSVAGILSLLFLNHCSVHEVKSGATDSSSTAANPFSPEVKTIVDNVCLQCHNGSGANGLVSFMAEPDQLLTQLASNGMNYIKAGDPTNSLIYLKVSSDTPPVGDRMPFGQSPLSSDQIESLRTWILGLASSVSINTPVADSNFNDGDALTTYTVSGTCNLPNIPVLLSVNGTSLTNTIACDGTNFTTTVDTTVFPFQNGANTLTATMVYNGKSTSSTITVNRLALAIALTTPTTGSFLTGTTGEDTYAVSGTCTATSGTITLTVSNASHPSGVSVGTTTCNGTTFSTTIDTTNASNFDGDASTQAANTLTASIVAAGGGTPVNSTAVVLNKFTGVPIIAIEHPTKPTGLRLEGQDSLDETLVINTTPTKSAYVISGTCRGQSIVIKLDGTNIQTGVSCSSGTFSTTVDATLWDNGNHALTAVVTDATSATATSNSVALFSYKESSGLISWVNDIKPLFTDPRTITGAGGSTNGRACIDCHMRTYNATTTTYGNGSQRNSYGEWAACGTSGTNTGGFPFHGASGDTCATPSLTGNISSGVNTISSLSSTGSGYLDVGNIITGAGINTFTLASSSTTASSTTVTVSSTANLTVGMPVSHANIPAGTKVDSIVDGTTFTMTNAATITGAANATLTFTKTTPPEISSIDSSTQVTLSSPSRATTNGLSISIFPALASSARSGFVFKFGYVDNPCTPAIAPITPTTITSGSPIVTVSSTSGITAGMKIYAATGIPFTAGTVATLPSTSTSPTYTTVLSVDSATQFTMSQNATSSTSYPISFFPSTLIVNCNNANVADSFNLISSNMDNYRKGITIVNNENSHTRNKIVRGVPSQSMMYNKIIASSPTLPSLMADTYNAKTGLVNAAPGTVSGALMPMNLTNYMSTGTTDNTTQTGKVYLWIMQGARTDN